MRRSQKVMLVLAAIGFAVLLLAVITRLVTLALDWRGFLAIAAAAVALVLIVMQWQRRLPKRAILEIALDQPPPEQVSTASVLDHVLPRPMTLREMTMAIERAANDPHVTGLLVRIAPVGLTLAQAQELADAVDRFRAAGKRAVAWAATLGEGHNTNGEYLLASTFDEVHLQPGSDLCLLGFALPQPYIRRLLDRIGVVPRLDGRKDYKTARYPLTESEMPKAAQQSLTQVVESLMRQLCAHVGSHRTMEPEAVRRRIDRGPLLDTAAVDEGVIDQLSHRDEVEDRLKRERNSELLPVARYLPHALRPRRRAARIGLIYGTGIVSPGRHRPGRLLSMPRMGADDIVDALRSAAESKRIRAVVLRIESPGGSAVASETIWRAVRRTSEAGTPVVVSMGSVAASGGYYIAAGADRIIAQPATLTGSIGVISGKLVTRPAWANLGVNWQTVRAGDHASFWQPTEDFDDPQWQVLQQMLDQVYERFKQRVAEGRSLDADAVEQIAQGRVWTGEAAKEHGLVDDLGGLGRAVEHAREQAGLPADRPVHLTPLPVSQPWHSFQLLPRLDAFAASQEALEEFKPLAQLLATLDPARDGWLRMPPWL